MSAEIWTLDIETRPMEVYSYRLYNEDHTTSQIIHPGGILMFAAKPYGGEVEHHTAWGDYDAMVNRLYEIYDAADYLITYNGKRFDNKKVYATIAQHGLPKPSPHRDIDLFRTVRKYFDFPSRSLDYVTRVFNLDPKTKPDGWWPMMNAILRPRSEEEQLEAQRRMVEYCRNDVVITEQLFDRLLPWIEDMNLPLYEEDSLDKPRCSRCGSDRIHSRGWFYTTSRRYRRFQCQSCGGWMKSYKSEPLINGELRSV